MLDRFLGCYLFDQPKQPTLIGITCDTISVRVNWENVVRIPWGPTQINLPYNIEMRVDYVKSDLNPLKDWSDPSSTTVNTGSDLTEQTEFFTQGSGSGLIELPNGMNM